MFKAKRRTVVTVTAVVAVLLGGALAVTLLTSGKGNAKGPAPPTASSSTRRGTGRSPPT